MALCLRYLGFLRLPTGATSRFGIHLAASGKQVLVGDLRELPLVPAQGRGPCCHCPQRRGAGKPRVHRSSSRCHPVKEVPFTCGLATSADEAGKETTGLPVVSASGRQAVAIGTLSMAASKLPNPFPDQHRRPDDANALRS
jgi:hypothetical protein